MQNLSPVLTAIKKIYRYYEDWASGLELACHKGCAACCTRNVTMTQAEGNLILLGLQEESRMKWLGKRLQIKGMIGRPRMTTNEWARNCIEGVEGDENETVQVLDPCPFLDHSQSCSIYRLRPFSCRCFGSSVDCSTTGLAEQPDILMEINTVTLQVIEHLGQNSCWGNMLDVLSALMRHDTAKADSDDRRQEEGTNNHLHRARPLPGFLVMPAQQAVVQTYLDGLYAIRVDNTPIGALLQSPPTPRP